MRGKDNIYYQARMQAAVKDPLHANRERTACEIYVSAESLSDDETGRTVPPCDVVQKMVECYRVPELKGQHIRAQCPLLPDYGHGCEGNLSQAALGWVLNMCDTGSVQDLALRFARVAQDGVLSHDERAEAIEIREKARKLRRVMEDTITAISAALNDGDA